MDGLLAHSLLVVTGKGGVGKSRVAAALGLAASRRGLRTIVVEVAARDDISRTLSTSEATGAYAERAVGGPLNHISIDPQRAMEEYLRQQLPFGALAGLLSRSQIFTTLTAATPGLRELLTVGKVWELAQPDRRNHGAEPYDLVVLDAPATGHGLAMLQAPSTFAAVARVGPVAKQGREVASFLGDPRRTAVVAVSTAEEMPVTETLELRTRLRVSSLPAPTAMIAALPLRTGEREPRSAHRTTPACSASPHPATGASCCPSSRARSLRPSVSASASHGADRAVPQNACALSSAERSCGGANRKR